MPIYRPDLLDDTQEKIIFTEVIAPIFFEGNDYTVITTPELHKLGDVVVLVDGQFIIIELETRTDIDRVEMSRSTWMPRTWTRKMPFHRWYYDPDCPNGRASIADSRQVLLSTLKADRYLVSMKNIPEHWSHIVQFSNDLGYFRIIQYRDLMFDEQGYPSVGHKFGSVGPDNGCTEYMVSTSNPSYLAGNIDFYGGNPRLGDYYTMTVGNPE